MTTLRQRALPRRYPSPRPAESKLEGGVGLAVGGLAQSFNRRQRGAGGMPAAELTVSSTRWIAHCVTTGGGQRESLPESHPRILVSSLPLTAPGQTAESADADRCVGGGARKSPRPIFLPDENALGGVVDSASMSPGKLSRITLRGPTWPVLGRTRAARCARSKQNGSRRRRERDGKTEDRRCGG